MTKTHVASETPAPGLTDRIYATVTALSMTIGRGPAARLIAGLAGVGPADRVVDVGCGPGTAVRQAARDGAAATGVDPDGAMLGLARLISAVRRAGPVNWLSGSAESLPLPDDSATVVWALSSAHHWADRGAGLAEAVRVLSPGGRLLIAERLTRPAARGHAAHGFTAEQADQIAHELATAGLVGVSRQTVPAGRKTLVVVSGARPSSPAGQTF
jgi:ubiquinone/menaquinone biosynthesis C-methylase UbiE